MAAGFDSFATVTRHGEHWAAIGGLQPKDGKRTARIIAIGDRSVCLARADDWINEHESAETAHRSNLWIKQPVTERQSGYLPAWVRRVDITRYEASCYLAGRFNRKLVDRVLALPERDVA